MLVAEQLMAVTVVVVSLSITVNEPEAFERPSNRSRMLRTMRRKLVSDGDGTVPDIKSPNRVILFRVTPQQAEMDAVEGSLLPVFSPLVWVYPLGGPNLSLAALLRLHGLGCGLLRFACHWSSPFDCGPMSGPCWWHQVQRPWRMSKKSPKGCGHALWHTECHG